MCNSLFLGKKAIPQAEDGEEFNVKVKGVYHTDENGVRKLDVIEVNGEEVEDPDECGCGESHEEPMDADDALELFLITNKKKK